MKFQAMTCLEGILVLMLSRNLSKFKRWIESSFVAAVNMILNSISSCTAYSIAPAISYISINFCRLDTMAQAVFNSGYESCWKLLLSVSNGMRISKMYSEQMPFWRPSMVSAQASSWFLVFDKLINLDLIEFLGCCFSL